VEPKTEIWTAGCLLALAIVVATIFGGRGLSAAASINLNGTWGYDEDKSEGGVYRQRYALDYAEKLELTRAMAVSSTMRYSLTEQDGVQQQLLSPSADFLLANDIFRYGVSGMINARLNDERQANQDLTWETSLESAWVNKLLPFMRLSYGQSKSIDDLEPRRVDSLTSFADAGIEYQYEFLKLFYRYYMQEGENRVAQNVDESGGHLAKLDLSRSFWRNRISFALSHQYSSDHGENTVEVGADGVALVNLQISQVAAGPEDNPLQTTELPNFPALVDGKLEAPALTVRVGENLSMVMRTSFQHVDMVCVYTSEELPAADRGFRWDVYGSIDGLQWTLLESDAQDIYNEVLQRFEININGVEELYLKVVAAALPLVDTDFSEIEVYRRVRTGGSFYTDVRDSGNRQTDFNFRLQLASTVQMSYGLSLNAQDISTSLDQESFSQFVSLQWNPGTIFSSTLNATESRQDYSDRPLLGTRSYALSVAATPVPTMDIALGSGRLESFEDGILISTSNNYTFYGSAVLLPDLNASLDVSFTEGEVVGAAQTNNSMNSRLRLTAWLLPSLEADVIGSYGESRIGEVTGHNVDGSMSINWRPSDILSVSGATKKSWVNTGSGPDSYSFSANFALNRNNQMGLNYAKTGGEYVQENYNLNWTWTMTEFFSMRSYGALIEGGAASLSDDGGGEEWRIGTELLMRSSIWE